MSRQDADAIAQAGAAWSEYVVRVLEHCFRAAPAIRTVSVEGRRPTVDWTRWQFGEELSVPLGGPIAIEPAR